MIKSACIEMMFTEVPFEERFELAKDAGFDYIEFWSWKDKNIENINELCVKYNLKVASFSADKEFSLVDSSHNESYIKFVEESIEIAKILNCKNLIIHSNALGDGGIVVNHYSELSDSIKFANMYYVLKCLAPIAEKNNVTLVLEALNTELDHVGNFLAYTKDSAELIQLVNSEYIKVLYDAYHMQINEGNIIDTLQKYINEIGYIHIADVPGRHEPGTGEINYKNVMNKLRELNYKGVIGFELSPLKSSIEASKEIMNL